MSLICGSYSILTLKFRFLIRMAFVTIPIFPLFCGSKLVIYEMPPYSQDTRFISSLQRGREIERDRVGSLMRLCRQTEGKGECGTSKGGDGKKTCGGVDTACARLSGKVIGKWM